MKIKIVKFYIDGTYDSDGDWIKETFLDQPECTEWEEISKKDYTYLVDIMRMRRKMKNNDEAEYALIVHHESEDQEKSTASPTVSEYKKFLFESIEKFKTQQKIKEQAQIKRAATMFKKKQERERKKYEELQKKFGQK